MKLKSDSNEKFNEITKDMILDGWEHRINSKGKVVVREELTAIRV